MLSIRVGQVGTADAGVHARAIAAALQSHPAALTLRGTVIIGCGGAAGVSGGPAPVVAVPMAWLAAPDALMRERIRMANAVVVADRAEVMTIRDVIAPGSIVVVGECGHDASTFLRGASPRDAAAAHDVVASHPELAAALRKDRPAVSIGNPEAMALACIEALIAAGATARAVGGATEKQG